MNTLDFREHDGIRLEFWESSPFVIPIPLEESISTTSDAITIQVKNTSVNSVPFCRNGTLFPELFWESGQAIELSGSALTMPLVFRLGLVELPLWLARPLLMMWFPIVFGLYRNTRNLPTRLPSR